MEAVLCFVNSSTFEPITGLTPTWNSLLKVSDGTDFTPQPSITEIGGGKYKFTIPSTQVCGIVDGGVALSDVDRYINDVAVGPEDIYLDADGVRAAVGLAAANLDSQLAAIPTANEIDTALSTTHGPGLWGSGASGANNVVLQFLKATGTAKTITAATKASACQLTIAAHGYTNGQKVVLAGIGGMVELNNRLVTVTVVDVDNITIGLDSTGFTTYTSGGTATLTDETALQDVNLAIYDGTDTNLSTTAVTNASGIGAQGANAYIPMSAGDYKIRPTRSLFSATGTYTFTVSASGIKYFAGTALSVPISGDPDTQVLSGTHTTGGRTVKAVALPDQIITAVDTTVDTLKTEDTTAVAAPHTWSLTLYRGVQYEIFIQGWGKKTITISTAAGADFANY